MGHTQTDRQIQSKSRRELTPVVVVVERVQSRREVPKRLRNALARA